MSLLFDLVHLRTIEVTPQSSNLDNVLSLAWTTSDSRRSSRRTDQAQYIYSGPLLRNSPVSVLDDVVIKCSLGQLVRSNINFSIDLLKELCRAHHVEGYSRRNPLAKELFLQALLWQCDPHCNACSNGVFGHNVRWVPEDDMKREESGIWKVLTNSTLRTDLRPPTYDFSAWRGALIDPRGPPTKPPRSLSNGFYRALDQVPANVRECFSNASQLERLVTARARAYKIVYKLTRFGDPKAQQKFTRGNTLIFSQNTASFTDVLPMSVEELADSVCVLFCGGSPNLAELDKCRPMIVKQSRIQKMLRWLINESKNPAYSAVAFDGERLAQLVRRSSGDAPLWESSDELLLSKLWPHLDPFGLVGFCVERDVKISLDDHSSCSIPSCLQCSLTFVAAANRSTRRHANWFVKSICTGSTSDSVDQCVNSAVRGPASVSRLADTGLHSTSFRGLARHSMNPVETEAQAFPSFSLLLFAPYPSHLIPSPIISSQLMKEAPTPLADGERTALSVDDVDRLAAIRSWPRTRLR
ncbi:BZ3500_MvSof-1268-A1-R1_Chr2-2g04790 [Microbotryum saponariae]|uniref:BZ3500_MvSof-1268-A1-R1_Chr2-2g04790 protein n=1 Tax=Microbotryum saponariae TaxID=289078 RepID=A0A2X0M6U9_9BASI|nr:BZ3500_MvSof-1268-A1-R1_Chr2-2g04790 [Microbotryum saponariae]SDA00171.1 BZ3501_MvSof-1269-A2-R1_Chr2-2g04464 [Microbotryum saponariae]